VGAVLVHEDRQIDRQTDGRTDMTKLIVAFLKFFESPQRVWQVSNMV